MANCSFGCCIWQGSALEWMCLQNGHRSQSDGRGRHPEPTVTNHHPIHSSRDLFKKVCLVHIWNTLLITVWQEQNLKGQFTQKTFSHLPLVLRSHADSFGFICTGFECFHMSWLLWIIHRSHCKTLSWNNHLPKNSSCETCW